MKSLFENGFATFDLPDPNCIHELVTQLNPFQKNISIENVNDARLSAIGSVNQNREFRERLLKQIKPVAQQLLGPDLAIQKSINLVVSLPDDRTSQIPLHADTWTGHSPFELVLLLPLARVTKDQNMFILPLPKWNERRSSMQGKTLQNCVQEWREDFHFLDLEVGQGFLFWHDLPHGNQANQDRQAHWSLNIRFKNLFTPYGQKGLGDYYIPWTMSPFTDFVVNEGGRCL